MARSRLTLASAMPFRGDPATSHRQSIVRVALEGILARLVEVPNSPEKSAIAKRAFECDQELEAWRTQSPGEQKRRELVGKVMDLAVEVMQLPVGTPGKAAGGWWKK